MQLQKEYMLSRVDILLHVLGYLNYFLDYRIQFNLPIISVYNYIITVIVYKII